MAEELKDPAFGLNDFKEPKILNVDRTLVNCVMMILCGKPGFYPSIPDLGMDVRKYLYNFDDEVDLDEIRATLINQCSDLITEVDSGNIDVQQIVKNEQKILVFILPTIKDSESSLILGVSLDKKGKLIYDFTFDKVQTI